MRIAVTGATGLVGQALVPYLRGQGHDVWRLVRGSGATADAPGAAHSDTRDVPWRPDDPAYRFPAGLCWDAVIHLAGAPVADGRWTAVRKAEILASRATTTRHLVQALVAMPEPPTLLISASAIGIYGNRGDELLTEAAAPGEGFLAGVCTAWETAARAATDHGLRVVTLRIGVVLSAHGGVLARLLPVFRAGLGGPVGNGMQWLSWIHRDDLLALIAWLLDQPQVAGAVHAVAPQPVRQQDFSRTLARLLHRPALVPAPAAALRLAFGAMADEVLLSSQRVAPGVAQAHGFVWRHTALASALRTELQNP